MATTTRRKLILTGLAAALASPLLAAAPARAGSSRRSSSTTRRMERYRLQDQLRVSPSHHRGRSHQDRRSLYRDDSILRREQKALQLSEPDRPRPLLPQED